MPDPLKGSPVEINGKIRTIIFTNHAVRVAQGRLGGRPMGEVVPLRALRSAAEEGVIPDLGMNTVIELVACGLLHEDATISDKVVEAMFDADPGAYFRCILAILAAWSEAQTRLMAPFIQEAANKRRAAGESIPPSNELSSTGGNPSADGPIGVASSGPAADSGSTPS